MNKFKLWTEIEENELLQEFKEISIDDIATKHNRSKKAIEIRLQDLAIKMEANGIPYETILLSTGISKELIENRKKSKEKNNEVSNTLDTKELALELKEIKLEIRELRLNMKSIEEMIKEIKSVITH